MNNTQLAIHFFLQIAVILLACRVVGMIAKRFGQPQVVAEMITGVLLGPTLFGALAPEWQAWIFPWDPKQTTRDTQSYLFPASQLGLAIYMFIVGMEFRLDIVRTHLRTCLLVSMAGMLAPFVLGAGLGYWIHQNTELFPASTTTMQAMLFLGASMCITAFPMLARIIHFKGLTGTLMGTVAIGAGAIDDAAAWCMLAVVLSSFEGTNGGIIRSIGGGLGLLVVAYGIVRPTLQRYQHWFLKEDSLTDAGLAMVLALMALGAFWTDWCDLHAVFGAFIIGTTIPRGKLSQEVTDRIQALAVVVLLPLFFTFSGLNTRITVDSHFPWLVAFLILLAAMAGKWGACSWVAKAAGLSTREAMGIGTLMNARGLMELIIINIGLSRGIISSELFACLVIMAVVTTLIASPAFDWLTGTRHTASR